MTTSSINDRHEGETRKAAAHSLLEATRNDLIREARHHIIAALLSRGWATIDDARVAVEVPPGINPKCFGSVCSGLSRAGVCRSDGMLKTGRREAHARHITKWVLTDAVKAHEWLRRNPLIANT